MSAFDTTNILSTVAITVLVGCVPAIMGALLLLVVHLATNVYRISEQMQVSSLDRHLAVHGFCSARVFGHGRLPSDGAHLLFIPGSLGLPVGLLVAVRSTTVSGRMEHARHAYTVYELGRGMSTLSTHISDDPRAVNIKYIYAPAPWRTACVTQSIPPPGPAMVWQAKAVAKLASVYAKNNRATLLVCGKPGIGKSTLGELLAVALKASGAQPEVVKNLDLTLRGVVLEDVYDMPVSTAPVILMLDEFDATIDHAERNEVSKAEATSLAETPAALLGILDRLNRTPHTVVIASTNRTLGEMKAGKYARYIRAGRFDIHLQA